MPVKEHRKAAEQISVNFCLIVTSDAVLRGERKDLITPLVKDLVASAGTLKHSEVVPNDLKKIQDSVRTFARRCDVVLVTGGTGIGDRDVSVDAVRDLCVKEIPGFGELFRHLTYVRHGTAALMSRAFACRVGYAAVFVTPGSPDAVNLALKELIIPESKHLVYELRRR
ncbi:MAG: molybdenum cofactor biosynthesis protein MoaB [Desulfurococcales archaeon]|nr:molybdenum cofactor biosynthesis protein MoaB [Desulfurococcales archaeon]